MENYTPTEDDFLDYHLGLLRDRNAIQAIEAHFEKNPADKARWSDFSAIEESFQNRFPVQEPNSKVLNSVRQMAEREVQPKFLSWFNRLPVRTLGWAMMVFVVIGLSYALQELRATSPYQPYVGGGSVAKTATKIKTTEAASFNGVNENSGNVNAEIKGAPQDTSLLKTYTEALGLFHGGKYRESAVLFEQIISTDPRFEKREDVYTYWVDALEKLGDTEKARQKRVEFQNLK